MNSSSLHGLVLAGGRSSRMGQDKGLLHYHNKPQREYLFDLLGPFCDKVFTSCRLEQEVTAIFNPIYDKFNIESPLNGILSAFDKYQNKAWLVVAVDMPFVNEEVLGFLVLHRDRTKVATCFYDSDGKFPEPLVTIWESAAFPLLMKFMNEGRISPREFLVTNDCKKLVCPNSQIHINVNSQEEFREIKEANLLQSGLNIEPLS